MSLVSLKLLTPQPPVISSSIAREFRETSRARFIPIETQAEGHMDNIEIHWNDESLLESDLQTTLNLLLGNMKPCYELLIHSSCD